MKDLITEIKQQLVEELGVSDKVIKLTDLITKAIIKDSKTLPYSETKEHSFTYPIPIFNTKIDIHYILTYVDTEDQIPFIVCESNMIEDGYYLKAHLSYVKELNKYVDHEGLLQHEVEHIYQMMMAGKYLLKPKSQEIYEKAIELSQDNNIYKKLVGYVIYYNNKFEKDAYANQIYKTIMDKHNINPYETLKNTAIYNNIRIIKEYILDTDLYYEYYKTIVFDNFGKSLNWFLKLTKSVVKNYTNKIGKVFAKAHKDLYKNKTPLDGGMFLNVNDKIDVN